MSKLAKSLKKGVKKIWSGAKKLVKKVVKSKIFWAIVIIVAIVVTYGAATAAVAPATTVVAPVATTVAPAASTWGTAAATTAGSTTTPTLASIAAEGVVAAPGAVGTGTSLGMTGASTAGVGAAGSAGAAAGGYVAGTGAAPGILNGLLGTAGKAAEWVAANPYPTALALTAAGNMLQEDPAKAQREWDEEDRLRRERNLDVAGVDLGVRPSARIDARTGDSSVINSRYSGDTDRTTSGSILEEQV